VAITTAAEKFQSTSRVEKKTTGMAEVERRQERVESQG
jgi:hypothetical protein